MLEEQGRLAVALGLGTEEWVRGRTAHHHEAELVMGGSTFRGTRQEGREKVTIDGPWKVSEQGFPKSGEPEEKLRFMLNYAVLASSEHNTQPYLFRVKDDAVELYADRTRALPVVDLDDRAVTKSSAK